MRFAVGIFGFQLVLKEIDMVSTEVSVVGDGSPQFSDQINVSVSVNIARLCFVGTKLGVQNDSLDDL